MNQQFENLEKMIYTLTPPEATVHDCAFVIDHQHVVTYANGDHSEISVGQQKSIYNVVDKNMKIEVTAIFKEVQTGILILKALDDYRFEIDPVELTWYSYVPRAYQILGVNQSDRSPVWQNGTLLKHSDFHVYYLGSTDGKLGNVVFDDSLNFVGLVIRKNDDQVVILKSELILTHTQTMEDDDAVNEQLERTLWTTTDPYYSWHRCAVAIGKNYAASFGHGSHAEYSIGQHITLYNVVNRRMTIEVIVTAVDKDQDYLVMKSTSEFPEFHTNFSSPFRGQHYRFLGVNRFRRPVWKTGIISFVNPKRSGFIYGSAQAITGDSGGFLISMEGSFLGLNSAKEKFLIKGELDTDENIIRVADHPHVSRIVPQHVFTRFIDSSNP